MHLVQAVVEIASFEMMRYTWKFRSLLVVYVRISLPQVFDGLRKIVELTIVE